MYRPGVLGAAPDALSRLGTVVMEPGWLGRVARAQHAPADAEMAKLVKLARSCEGRYRLRGEGDTPVLYRVGGESDQLVIPASGGLRELVLAELHDTLLGGHMGYFKTMSALVQRVWWPKMGTTVRAYVSACPIC